MMDVKQFSSAISQICEEKGIDRDKVIETIEMAIAAAYKKDYGKKGQIIKAKFNEETGEIKISQIKIVVEKDMLKDPEKEEGDETKSEEKKVERVTSEEEKEKIKFNPEKHIMVDEAQAEYPGIKATEEIEIPLETREDFGRIAAQTAKQVILQRIREAERDTIYKTYKQKEGEVVTGIIQRIENGNIFLDIGKLTGILFPSEQIRGERYQISQRIKVYVQKTENTPKDPLVVLSRKNPELVKKLFELEVPEIFAGTVEIKAIAREAGSRSKIAVASKEEGIDPVGSCVGQKGTRVQAVINEIGGEKIDIIEWNDDPKRFISNALSPAKVNTVEILDSKAKDARVEVPEDQLSLAIGREGQNVGLAARLTGWKIDVRAPKKEEKAEDKTKEEGKENETEDKEKDN